MSSETMGCYRQMLHVMSYAYKHVQETILKFTKQKLTKKKNNR